ncbi:uncharacterized protein LOC118413596 [Branchiostoma floridae]|uniref:Uncharacterized protein LOC118413596 n=1 Tax=Branchiostoma floridae TaxID=7739 RepID=A0A9J7KZA8_BRAFL|nr:uncharacterized protein LOC118413596 [Branchiostoma floridae]
MEGQSSATTASPHPVPVDEMRSTRDSTAAQESDRGYECCDWAGTDKNVPECETGNKGASTSCTPSVGEIRSQHDTIVYVLQDVQSNKMVIQVPVIADESGVINCAESGLAESKDTPTVVRDPQASSLTGPDCDSLDVPDKAGNKSSTYDVTECSSHVDLVTGESHRDKTITVLSTDTHNRTTIVECNSRFIPQVDLTQTTSCTKNSSPQRDTEAQKEGNLGHHLLDAAVRGKCVSTSGDSLLSETTNDKQILEDGKEGEKSLGVARIGTGGVEDKVKTAHKLLMAASSCQSGSLPPFSLSMLITDRKQQGQTKKGAWGRSGLFNKETSTVIMKRSTELSENQNVFEEGPHAAQPEEQQQMLSCDTKVLSHNEEQALGHAPKGHPEMEKKSESGGIPADAACEAKDGDSGLIFVEPGKKSEPLTEDEDMEEAGSGNMHVGHPDCSSANAVKATDVVTWERSLPKVKDNRWEDYIGNSEEKLMEEDMGSTKGKTSKSIEVSTGLDEKMTAEENMPEVGNSESTSNKSEAFPREANRKKSYSQNTC